MRMMQPGRFRSSTVPFSVLLVVVGSVWAGGCAQDEELPAAPALESSTTGSLVVSVDGGGNGGDWDGFQIDVARAGVSVHSSFVAVGPASNDGGAPGASTLVVLVPGSYSVTATVMRAGRPATDCTPAAATVAVAKGQTSDVTLIARCQKETGAVHVSAGINRAPELVAVTIAPSTTGDVCADVRVGFDAVDRDGDPIACDVALGNQDPTPVPATPVAGAGASAVHCEARVAPTAAGEQSVRLRACDARGCVAVDVPLHIRTGGSTGAASAAGCPDGCDDGNPCTDDQASPAGVCRHSPVSDGSVCSGGNLRVQILGINDFHGQLETGRRVSNRPVGGAAVLAAYLKSAQAGIEDQTIIVHAGDHVGASPPASALLQDEPSIAFLNALANPSCSFADKLNPRCNVVGTLGNHEFDEGKEELARLLTGGNFPSGPFLEDPYPGARFPYVSANVIEAATGLPVLRPFVVKDVRGVKVGFIGAVLRATPTIVTPTGVAGLQFIDEVAAINTQVAALRALGVRSIVVTIHQGGFQTSYLGPTQPASMLQTGSEIQSIVSRLDDEIDVVISGHTHAFTNALVRNANDKEILVVQAFSAGTAYDDVDLLIDPVTGDVVAKTAQIVTTYGDAGPGLLPDPAVDAIVSAAVARVAPLVGRVFGTAPTPLTRDATAAGESVLGNVIADAQRVAVGTQIAFMNPGGIRADLDAGDITFGELFTIQPFGNTLVKLDMTGAQILAVLEQQWLGQPSPRILQISGIDYLWDPARAFGSRIVDVRVAGVPLVVGATYSVTTNNFLATGGDGFTSFTAGSNQIGGPVDLDALIEYVEDNTPLVAPARGRIRVP